MNRRSHMYRLGPIAFVATSAVLACARPVREQEPAGAGPTRVTAPSPTMAVDAGARRTIDQHFVFKGAPADRERARARVGRALERYAASSRRDMGMPKITSLDDHLDAHYVEVSPDGAVLHVLTYPAANAAWEVTFEVTAADDVTKMTAAPIEPPPR